MSAVFVVNPRSAAGRTKRQWKHLSRALDELYPNATTVMTRKRGDATGLVRAALDQGAREIIAIGGDGTINEAVNGFFENGLPIAPHAVLGFVTSGTGGDFRKSFGVDAGAKAALARLKSAKPRAVDVGRVTCVTQGGGTAVRHFINIASVGLSGEIVAAVNKARFSKLFGGRIAFAWHSVLALLTYRGKPVRVRVDGGFDETVTISTMAIANGRYFGGGMQVAPNACVDDGRFDIIVMEALSGRHALSGMQEIYSGAHLSNPAVRVLSGSQIMAAPVAETRGRPVLIEVDGESAGQLPATFEILPRALLLRV